MDTLCCEYMKRAAYLDELYDSVKKVSGLSVESILGLFAAGYTLKLPKNQKTMEDIAKKNLTRLWTLANKSHTIMK